MTWLLLFACATTSPPATVEAAPAPSAAPVRLHQFIVAPSGTRVGLGGTVYADGDAVRFARPRQGYPLEAAGISGGEALRVVNGVRVTNVEQARQLLSGEADESLLLVVAAPGTPPQEKQVFLTVIPDLACFSLEVPYREDAPRVRYESEAPVEAVPVVCPSGEDWTPASVEADARG